MVTALVDTAAVAAVTTVAAVMATQVTVVRVELVIAPVTAAGLAVHGAGLELVAWVTAASAAVVASVEIHGAQVLADAELRELAVSAERVECLVLMEQRAAVTVGAVQVAQVMAMDILMELAERADLMALQVECLVLTEQLAVVMVGIVRTVTWVTVSARMECHMETNTVSGVLAGNTDKLLSMEVEPLNKVHSKRRC